MERTNIDTNRDVISDLLLWLNLDKNTVAKLRGDRQLLPVKLRYRFFVQLGVLLTAGLDIQSTLSTICSSEKKFKGQEIIEEVLKQLINGMSFAESLRNSGGFTNYDFHCVRMGEQNGILVSTVKELTKYYKTKMELKRNLIGAISYPILVIVVAIGVVFFMLNFVVPLFMDVFNRFDSELPAITKYILTISGFVSSHLIMILICVLVLFIVIYLLTKGVILKKYTDTLLLKIPIIGELIREVQLSRLFHFLYLLTKSKTPLNVALVYVEESTRFIPMAIAIEEIRNEIIQGSSLSNSMNKQSLFNQQTVSLVKAGEETNQLEEIFLNLSSIYQEDVQHHAKLISSMIEPVTIIVLGVIIALILVALYLPIFELSNSFI